MRLVSCEIGGFGKISAYSHTFREGLNAFCEDNGWGKTTFSVFVKAMFYGMEYSRKQGLSEREHYRPWDGGVYGGSLVFEVGGRRYRVERTFGKKDKDDTFALYDDVTGKPSEDFGVNLGEEIFEVDRDSFGKSTFIPQEGLETTMTDSINAKMGDLSTAKDDINNFDRAVKAIDEARKNYTRRSKTNTGKLEIMKRQMRECNELLEQQEAMNKGYEERTELLEQRKRSLQELEGKKAGLAEQIRMLSRQEQSLGQYREKKRSLERHLADSAGLDAFFAAGIPKEDELKDMENLERRMHVARREIEVKQEGLPPQEEIERLEMLFASGVPEEADLSQWNLWAGRLKELRVAGESHKLSEDMKAHLQEMSSFFERKLPQEEEMAAAEERVTELIKLEGRADDAKTRYQTLLLQRDQMERSRAGKGGLSGLIVCLFLCIALAGGGIAFRTLAADSAYSLPLQIVCFGGALLILSLGCWSFLRSKGAARKAAEELERQVEEAREALERCENLREEQRASCKAFLSDFLLPPLDNMQQMVHEVRKNLDLYNSLRQEERKSEQEVSGTLEELADLQLRLYTALAPFAEVYHIDLYHEPQEEEVLRRLQRDRTVFENYRKDYSEMLSRTEENREMEESLQAFLGRFPTESGEAAEQLKEIRSKYDRRFALAREIRELKGELSRFEQEHQIDESRGSVEELQKQQDELDAEAAELNRTIAQDRENLSAMAEELERFEEAQTRREQLTEDIESAQQRVKLLENTARCLQMARDSFLSRYMKPLQEGLEKYRSRIDRNAADELASAQMTLDMDLSVHISYLGNSREADYLSAGYRNLIAFCSRLALLDVLYQKEQPVLILDDPFTNLDPEKIRQALNLLREIAGKRQVLYFTCHESRMPQM